MWLISLVVLLFIRAAAGAGTIELTPETVRIDGNPRTLLAGSVEYAGLPADQWPDRLLRLRQAGFGVVSTSVPWSLYASTPQQTAALSDLERFLVEVRRQNLLALVRIGPWIGQGTALGGLPAWLSFRAPAPTWRTNGAAYLTAVDAWLSVLLNTLAGQTYPRGGPVIALQIEEDYAYDQDPANGWATGHIDSLRRIVRRQGIDLPVFRSSRQLLRKTEPDIVPAVILSPATSASDWDSALRAAQSAAQSVPFFAICETRPVADRDTNADSLVGTGTRWALFRGAALVDWRPFAAGLWPPVLQSERSGQQDSVGAAIDVAGGFGPAYDEARRCTGWLNALGRDYPRSRPSAWCTTSDPHVLVAGRSAVGGARTACLVALEQHRSPLLLSVAPREGFSAQTITTTLPPGSSKVICDNLLIDGNARLGLCTAELFAIAPGETSRVVFWDYPGASGTVTVEGIGLELASSDPDLLRMVDQRADRVVLRYASLDRELLVPLSAPTGNYVIVVVPRAETALWWIVPSPDGAYLIHGPRFQPQARLGSDGAIYVDTDHVPGQLNLTVYPPFRVRTPAALVVNGVRFSSLFTGPGDGLSVSIQVPAIKAPQTPLEWEMYDALPEPQIDYDDSAWMEIGGTLQPFEACGNNADLYGWYRTTFSWEGHAPATLTISYRHRVTVFVNGQVVHRGSQGHWQANLDRFLVTDRDNVVALLAVHQGRTGDIFPTDPMLSDPKRLALLTGVHGVLTAAASWRFRAGLSPPNPSAVIAGIPPSASLEKTISRLPLSSWRIEAAGTNGAQQQEEVAERGYDDKSWRSINLTGALGQWHDAHDPLWVPGWQGNAWFRARFPVPVDWPSVGMASLDLGRFSGEDRTFVNGRLVGQSSGNAHRIYELDLPALFRDRYNTVAIQMTRHEPWAPDNTTTSLPEIRVFPLAHEGLWYRCALPLTAMDQTFLSGAYTVTWGLILQPHNEGFIRFNGNFAGCFSAGEKRTFPLPGNQRATNTIEIFERAVDYPTGYLTQTAALVPLRTVSHSSR